jgi:hypothetical protein
MPIMALKKKGSEIFYENKIRMFVDEEVELKLGNNIFFPFTNIAKQSWSSINVSTDQPGPSTRSPLNISSQPALGIGFRV